MKRCPSSRIRLALLDHVLALLPLLSGCPGRLEGWPATVGTGGSGDVGNPGTGGAGDAPPPCDAPNLWFKAELSVGGCGTQGCHDQSGASSISGINLVDGTDSDIWRRLLNQPSTKGIRTNCEGMILVNPSKPPSGILIKRISDPAPCGPGSLMPIGASTPNPETVKCITGWVNAQLN